MLSWTRITLLSAMLFTATIAFAPAPATAAGCQMPINVNECIADTLPPIPCNGQSVAECTGVECLPGDCVPPVCGGTVVDCVENLCGGTLNDCLDKVPCVVGYGCICDNLGECIPQRDIPCTDYEPCPADNQRIWLKDYSVVRTQNDTTVTVVLCERDGYPCNTYSQRIPVGDGVPTIPPLPSTCIPYNPAAITNACVTLGEDSKTVNVPSVVTSPYTECIIGNVCATVPVPGVGPSSPKTVEHPDVDGYVEVTRACATIDQYNLDRYGATCYVPL